MNKAITHIVAAHMDIDQGLTLIAKIMTTPSGVFHQGVGVRLSTYMHRMFQHDRINVCACCNKPVDGFAIAFLRDASYEDDGHVPARIIPTIEGQFATCDHIIPQTLGGTHHPRNMQTMCAKCNSNKRHFVTVEDFEAVKDQAHEVVDPQKLFTAARAITKTFRKAKHEFGGIKKGRPVPKQIVSTYNRMVAELDNLRLVIKFAHEHGISMVPYRQAQND